MPKLKIIPYNQKFPKIFEQEKNRIAKATGIKDIHHIGSTAVPGLGGKGIIDIMIGLKSWKGVENIIKELHKLGFRHIHPKEKGKIFLSKHRQPTPDNVHLHLVRKDSKQYQELLAFRNYLRKNNKEIAKFFQLKQQWSKNAQSDRSKYGDLKAKYVKKVLKNSNRLSAIK